MSEKESNIEISTGFGWVAFVLFIIAFWGEPDIVDAIIYALMK